MNFMLLKSTFLTKTLSMKKLFVFALLLYCNQNIFSQNTFPASGNVGIGLTNPTTILQIKHNGNFNGSLLVIGTQQTSHFHYGTNEDTYIRGGKSTSNVYINDYAGNTFIASGSSGRLGVGTTNPIYRLDVNGEAIISGWIRTRGVTGWYNETYGGGMYMADNVWVRTYGSKNLYVDRTIRTDGELQVGPNGDRFLVNGSGNTGIGTTAPGEKLHVMGNVKAQSTVGGARLYFQSPYARWNWETGNGNESSAILTRWAANGTAGAQVMVAQFDGNIRFPGVAGGGDVFYISQRGESFSKVSHYLGGTDRNNSQYRLRANGGILQIQRYNAASNDDGPYMNSIEVKHDNSVWMTGQGNGSGTTLHVTGSVCIKPNPGTNCVPDYVFDKDYPLMQIPELEQFLQTNKHLPNVPSGKEINETGYDYIKMSNALLEKIEENTLYMIQLHKRLEQMEFAMQKLKADNDALKNIINKQ
jgi:Bacterial shufflon protein, N-terminal constant region